MSDHPSRGPADDPAEEALVRRVAAAQAARLGYPVPIDQDPAAVRATLVAERDAAVMGLATLRPDRGAAVPDALDAALGGLGPDVAAWAPAAVAVSLVERLPAQYRAAFVAAVNPELDRFENGDGGRELAELCMHRIGDTVRATIAETITAEVRTEHPDADTEHVAQAATAAADTAIGCLADTLREYLLLHTGLPMLGTVTDKDFESRCRRAAVMNALAQIRGDGDMQSEAVRLAIAVCFDRPSWKPSDVFRAGTPLLMLPADATPAEVDAALCAELVALADADDGAP